MRALFDDAAFSQHQDAVGLLHRAQAVRDHERGAAAHQLFQRPLQAGFGVAVDAGGGFVQDQDLGVAIQRAGEGNQLAFAGRKIRAVFVDAGIDAAVAGGKEIERADAAQHVFDARPVGQVRGRDVAGDRAREEHDVLRDNREAAPELLAREARDVIAIDAYGAALDLVQAQQKSRNRGLSRAGRADQRDPLTAPSRKAHFRQDRCAWLVAEADVLEL